MSEHGEDKSVENEELVEEMNKPSKLSDMKAEVEHEIEQLEKHLSDMDKLRNDSISKIEAKKNELRRLSEIAAIRQEHSKAIEELKVTKADIKQRRLSIAFMDQTIADLDTQISEIQAKHDQISGELDLKRNRLREKIKFYEELNQQIEKLVALLKSEETLFQLKLESLEKQKEGLLNNADLSPDVLEQSLRELDEAIERLRQEHEAVQNQLKIKLSVDVDPTFRDDLMAEIDRKMVSPLLTEKEVKEVIEHEAGGRLSAEPMYGEYEEDMFGEAEQTAAGDIEGDLSEAERLFLTRQGLLVTPTGNRIITKDNRILTLKEARRLLDIIVESAQEVEESKKSEKEPSVEFREKGMMEEEATVDEEELMEEEKEMEKELFHESFISQISTAITESSSSESVLSNPDINYLKRVFGKALSLGLAEITQVQPFDPIHYLAHWLFKYRFNQEIQQIKQRELEELLAERKRIEDEKNHEILEAEAKQAVLDAWLRAEELIMTREMMAKYDILEEEEEFHFE